MTTDVRPGVPTLVLEPELEDFRHSLRGFLERWSAEEEVRRAAEMPAGHDEKLWRRLCEELGLPGLSIPEELGGSGAGHLELVPVHEELGRSLAVTPYFATVALASNLLLAADDAGAVAELLPALASGERTATVAWTGRSGALDPDDVRVDAAGRLTGRKSFVVDGASADLVLVVAAEGHGLSVFAVEGDAEGLTRTPMTVVDGTRKQALVELDGTAARRVGTPGGAAGALDRMRDLATVALVLEQVGGAERCLEMGVAYAKERLQFGRPIGSFQAIKHTLADLAGLVQTSRALAWNAAWTAAHEPTHLRSAASAAKSWCSTAYRTVAEETIQVHGAIGFTWEHPCHLYFKRACSSEVLLGTPVEHRRRLGGSHT